jgi:mannose-6-phosphate isomerase
MLIDNKLIDEITTKAEESARLRMSYNLHKCQDAKAQCLLNVLLPGTNLPIHRHRHNAETYILLRGKMIVVFYDGTGAQIKRFPLDPTIGNYDVQILAGLW